MAKFTAAVYVTSLLNRVDAEFGSPNIHYVKQFFSGIPAAGLVPIFAALLSGPTIAFFA